jgi:hypothetical protein
MFIIIIYNYYYSITQFINEIGGRSSSKVVRFTGGCVTVKCNRKREENDICVVFGFRSFSRKV